MDFLKSMQQRYTTKMYDSTKKVSKENLNQLKAILHLSPSSINSQPWQFVFVEDDHKKARFAEVSFFNEPKISKASCLVIFRVANAYEQILPRLNDGQRKYFETNIQPLSANEIKAWMSHQVYLALGVLLSACAQMGIDATPMEGIDKTAYDGILNQTDYSTLFGVAIGYRDTADANQIHISAKQRLNFDDVILSL